MTDFLFLNSCFSIHAQRRRTARNVERLALHNNEFRALYQLNEHETDCTWQRDFLFHDILYQTQIGASSEFSFSHCNKIAAL